MKGLTTRTKRLFLSLFLGMSLLATTSCGSGSSNIQIPGVQTPEITMLGDTLLISMVLENLQLEGGLRYNVPKYPNSYIEISPDFQSSGTLIAISVSVEDVFGTGAQSLDPQTLPGGRALPGVASGRLPAVAFTIESLENMSFYVGPKFFGVFVPVEFGAPANSIITGRFKSGKINAGTLSAVGPDTNGDNSGVLLLIDLQSKAAEYFVKKAKID